MLKNILLKCQKVIDSCKTIEQTYVTQQYLSLALSLMKKQKTKGFYHYDLYDELYNRVRSKRSKILKGK